MWRLIRELVRPHRRSLLVILLAMLVETAMSIAAPWPLKIIIDEHLVIDALERLMKGRTVITIAHRLSTIRDADRIIVISGGTVAESGSHDELLALGGIYSGIYHAQFKDESAKVPGQNEPAQSAARAGLKAATSEGV
jgi:ABC-type multidrug transport system fused ATPase/permease subunit